MPPQPPGSTLFPYTTLFRSRGAYDQRHRDADRLRHVRLLPAGADAGAAAGGERRSEEHTSELQSRPHLVCRLLLEKKNTQETLTFLLTQKKTGAKHDVPKW